MAKGLRASRRKTNNSKLRAKVFKPVEDARTKRLSAKLLELASAVKPNPALDTQMDVDRTDSEKRSQLADGVDDTKMEDVRLSNILDSASSLNHQSRSKRVEKRRSNRSNSLPYLGPGAGRKSRNLKKKR
ncbi:MAG: hypothetical protein M1815_002373 [Lichina confinis]|nr:MAG: hypothetical protein M1815_002373 [Lichina confinis]